MTGEHLVRCRECGKSFICGDCIESTCYECECKSRGHLWVGGFCGRCGAKKSASRPTCSLCKKPIEGRVYYQADNTAFPVHKDCRIIIKPSKDGGI